MRYKLVAFDMDGTLLVEESCWGALHRHFGTSAQARKNLEAYEWGEIDYVEFMRRDISLWKPVPHISEIERVLASFTLAPNVAEVVKEIGAKGHSTAIITGGLNLLADRVARELGIHHTLANGLGVDERGYLTGEGIFRVEPTLKHEALAKLAADLGLKLSECAAVGDSKYDVSFLKNAGLGVAVGDDPILAEVADVVIRDFKHFPQLLNYI